MPSVFNAPPFQVAHAQRSGCALCSLYRPKRLQGAQHMPNACVPFETIAGSSACPINSMQTLKDNVKLRTCPVLHVSSRTIERLSSLNLTQNKKNYCIELNVSTELHVPSLNNKTDLNVPSDSEQIPSSRTMMRSPACALRFMYCSKVYMAEVRVPS